MQRLNEFCALPKSLGLGDVFRVLDARQDDWLKCGPKKPLRPHTFCVTPWSWWELQLEEAEHGVLAGQSLLVEGAPGPSKKYTCKGLVELLRAQGKKVDVISKTHSASSQSTGFVVHLDTGSG